jgi:hypothetical protein
MRLAVHAPDMARKPKGLGSGTLSVPPLADMFADAL